MALSYVQYEGDGQQETFAIPFPYLDQSHIEVRVALDVHPYTWDDPNTIRISPAPPAGVVVEARRITPRETRMVDFVDGSVLTESDLDLANLQTFYIVQEAIDIAGGTLELLSDGSFGAGGRRIRELGNPIENRDAVTKEYHDGTWIPQMQALLTSTTNEKNAAITARQGAETAKAGADTAKAGADASKTAAATSEANALSYKNAAATSASNAATSEGNALSYKNAAATSASNAATSEANAAASASTASTKATEAANSATAAANSAAAAAQSAQEARAYDPYAILPIGGIIMWSGTVASIPSNWKLCDGQNGTPDLRDRFIVGAGGSYGVGSIGGQSSVTLTANHLPAHTHTFSATTSTNGDHSHTASTGSAGAHTHTYVRDYYDARGGGGPAFSTANGTASDTTSSAGAHTHTVSIGTAGAHAHTVSGTTSSAGNGQAFDVRPPYYALAFIMRVA